MFLPDLQIVNLCFRCIIVAHLEYLRFASFFFFFIKKTLLLDSCMTHQVDKKVADGLLRLILLKGSLGRCVFTGDYDRNALDETLHAFCDN